MNDDIQYMQEFMQMIRRRQSEKLDKLRRSGELRNYILYLHQSMTDKYPDMIEHTYTEDEIEGNGREQ